MNFNIIALLTFSLHGNSNSTARTGLGTVARRSESKPYTSTICHLSGTPRLWRNCNVSTQRNTVLGKLWV